MSTGGPCKEQLAIEEERISEKYAQEEAEAKGNLSNLSEQCRCQFIWGLLEMDRNQDFSSPGSREFEEKKQKIPASRR